MGAGLAQAQTVLIKTDTATMNQATDWTPNVLPGVTNLGRFDNTLSAGNAGSLTLGANLTLAGLVFSNNLNGPVSVGGGNMLTLNSTAITGGAGINMGMANQNVTLNCGLTLAGKQSWTTPAGETLTLGGGVVTTGAGVDFTSFGGALSGLSADASGVILGPWATVGSGTALAYAAVNGGVVSGFVGGTALPAAGGSATANYTLAGATALTGTTTGDTLQYSGAAGTLALGANTLTLNGLMHSGTGALTINGTGKILAGANQELVIAGNTQSIIITNVVIANSAAGASALTLNGVGAPEVVLGGVQTFTGPTVVNSGTLLLAGPNANPSTLTASSGLTINSGAVVQLLNDNCLQGSAAALGNLPVTINPGGKMLETSVGGAHIRGLLTLNGGNLSSTVTGGNADKYGDWDLDYSTVATAGGPVTSTIDSLRVIPDYAGGTTFYVPNGNTPSGIDLNITGQLYKGTTTADTGIIKTGGGVMAVSFPNSYGGATTISAGTLLLLTNAPSGAIGALGNATSAVILGNAATVNSNASPSLIIGGPFTVARPVTVANQATTGAYTIGCNQNTNAAFSGLITINQPLTVWQAATTGANALVLSGGVIAGTGTSALTFAGPGNVNVTTRGIADGGGQLAVKIAGGAVCLSAVNSYTGGTIVTNANSSVAGTLGVSNTIAGNVTVSSSSGGALARTLVSGGSDTITGNLTYGSNAEADFVLGPTFSGATNGQVQLGGNLVCGGDSIGINCGPVLDTSGDYVLFKLTGASPSLSGSFAQTPVWLGSTPANASYYSIVTSGNTVTLHYYNPNVPTGVGTANPASLPRNASTMLTVLVTPAVGGSSSITSVAVNLGAIGLGNLLLVDSGNNRTFTNTVSIGLGLAAGTIYLPVTITDGAGVQGMANIALTILPASELWSGGAANNNWSSALNWNTAVSPATGDLVFFGSGTYAPVMDANFTLGSVTFNSGAGSFVITNSGGSVLTIQAGVTNNSANAQTINVPMTLTVGQTFSAAAGALSVGKAVNNGGNSLTVADGGYATVMGGVISGTGGLTKTGPGTNTLSAANTFTGGVFLNGGTVNVNAAETAGTSGPLGALGGIVFGGGTLQFSAADAADYSGRFSSLPNQLYNIDTGSQTVTFASALTSAGGTLRKLGSGTLTLSSAGSSFSGNITINAGTVSCATAAANVPTTTTLGSQSGTRTITVNAGATLLLNINNVCGNVPSVNIPRIIVNGGTLNAARSAPYGLSNDGASGLTLQNGAVFYVNNGGQDKSPYYDGWLGDLVTVNGTSGSSITCNANTNSVLDLWNGTSTAAGTGGSTTFNVAATGSAVDLSVTAPLGDSGYAGGAPVSAGLIKAGNGTMRLAAPSLYSGATVISAGTLMAGTNSPYGQLGAFGGSAISAITLGDQNTISSSPGLLIDGAFYVARPVTIASQPTTGTYTIGGSKDANANFSGSITVNEPLTISQVANTGTNGLTISGGISSGGGSQTITFVGPGKVTVNTSGIYDSAGQLAVNIVGGTANLSTANGYSGGTTVSNASATVAGTLGGNGTIAGNVEVASSSPAALARTLPGGAAVCTFNGNLTYGANAEADFALSPFATGANDQIVLNGAGSMLTCGGISVGILCGALLDKAQDYVLFDLSSASSPVIAGSFNPTPRWLGSVPSGSAYYSVVVTNGNQVVLHYAGPSAPVITSASANPSSVVHNQTVTFDVAVTTGANPTIASVVVDLSSLGGITNQALFNSGGNVFTNTIVIAPAYSLGSFNLPVLATDGAGVQVLSVIQNFTINSQTATWNGASTVGNNWTDNNNWANQTGPGVGDSATLDGTLRTNPVVNTNYLLIGLTFDGSAGGFSLTNSGGGSLILTSDISGNLPSVVNNSPNPQVVGVPVILGAPLTLNAQSANLMVGAVNEGTNALTTTDGGFNTVLCGPISGSGGLIHSGSGTNILAGTNSYSGSTTLTSGGTLQLQAAAGNTNAAGISAAMSPFSVLTLNSGSTLQLRGDANVSFAPSGVTLDSASDTYNFDVGPLTSASGNTLALNGALSFPASANQTINVTGNNSYTLGLGNLIGVTTSHNPYFDIAINTLPDGAGVALGTFQSGNYSQWLQLQGGGRVTITGSLTNISNGSSTVYVTDGTTATLQGRSSLSSTASATADAYKYCVANGALVLDNGAALTNNTSGAGLTASYFILGAATNVFGVAGSFSAPAGVMVNTNNNWNAAVWLGDASHAAGGITLNAKTTNNVSDGDVGFVNSGVFTIGGQNTSGTNTYANTIILGLTANKGKSVTLAATAGGEVDFSGPILANGTDITAGVTVGDATHSGVVKLLGANTYAGGTAVSNGTLLVSGSLAAGAVTVSGGATLGGTGTIGGPVNWLPGAAAWFSSGAPLTVSGALTLNNNPVTINVPGAAPLAAGAYTLATYAAAGSTGSFSTNFVVTGAGIASGNLLTLATGGGAVMLNVASLVNPTPTNIVSTLSGNLLALSWPMDHTGWRLQVQTNSSSAGLTTNWFTWPNSTMTNSVSILINPANPTVFFRMVYP